MKKKLFKISLIIVSTLVLITLFLFAYEYKSEQEQLHNKYRLSKAEMDSLQDGDIILRQGFGIVSESISKTLSEEYRISHCAIVRRPNQDSIVIIHSVSSSLSDVDGVQTCEINKFIQESQPNTVIVVRFISNDGKSNSAISERANYYLHQQIPFDSDFDVKDSTKFFCTELIWKVLIDEYHKDILNIDKPDQLNANKFSVFWDSPHFKVILNHQKKG